MSKLREDVESAIINFKAIITQQCRSCHIRITSCYLASVYLVALNLICEVTVSAHSNH